MTDRPNWMELARQEQARRDEGKDASEAWRAVEAEPALTLPKGQWSEAQRDDTNKVYTAEAAFAARELLRRRLPQLNGTVSDPAERLSTNAVEFLRISSLPAGG